MTKADNSITTDVRQDSRTGRWFVYCPDTGHRWALQDTIDQAWAVFYADLYATWPTWAPAKEARQHETIPL